jgi:hypothetical protein
VTTSGLRHRVKAGGARAPDPHPSALRHHLRARCRRRTDPGSAAQRPGESWNPEIRAIACPAADA